MSEHDVEPLSPEIVDLLSAERAIPSAPRGHRERVHERLGMTLGLGPGGGGEGGGAGSPPPSPHVPVQPRTAVPTGVLAHPLALALGTFVLGGMAGAGIHASLGAPPAVRPTPALVVSVRDAAPLAPSSAALPTAIAPSSPLDPRSGAPPAPRIPATPESAGGAPGRDLDLGAERALLDVARTAVGRGQPASALDALGRHAREFPRGRLREEREALYVQALAMSGRAGEAEQRASGFKKTYPESVLGPAVAAAASAPGSSGPASGNPGTNSVTDAGAPPQSTR